MRKFVPILFLYGCQLDLVVFTHDGYNRTDIGCILCKDENERLANADEVCSSLRKLCFLLTRPIEDFGFLCSHIGTFTHALLDPTSQPASFVPMNRSIGSTMQVIKQIERKVHITGRCTYLFSVRHGANDAILKLSWIRTNRLPEGAVYAVLCDGGVPNIPEIFESGILVDDFCGFRLEYLVMESCGASIVDYIQDMLRSSHAQYDVASKVKCHVATVTQTLTAALRTKILHRDISAGNITVKNGRAYVIDWGCAKFMAPPSDVMAEEIRERWGFDSAGVVHTEGAKDPFTGTSKYMSIQVLLKVPRRCIFNDIESLLYVILDALSDRPRDDRADSPPGFVLLSELSLAIMRIGILLDEDHYLADFGVSAGKESVPKDMLSAMYAFLFTKDGQYIGKHLRGNYSRQIDEDLAKRFMDANTLESLLEAYKEPESANVTDQTPTRELSQSESPVVSHGTLARALISRPQISRPQAPSFSVALAAISLSTGADNNDDSGAAFNFVSEDLAQPLAHGPHVAAASAKPSGKARGKMPVVVARRPPSARIQQARSKSAASDGNLNTRTSLPAARGIKRAASKEQTEDKENMNEAVRANKGRRGNS
ncbi:hypothetical protein GGI21_001849 [Coemansia aciculifera]|nr:hypothetical protein GGI21_001849 [Coemansia aciculifera]